MGEVSFTKCHQMWLVTIIRVDERCLGLWKMPQFPIWKDGLLNYHSYYCKLDLFTYVNHAQMVIVFASLILQNLRQITWSDRLGFLMKCLLLELPKLHLIPSISEMPLSSIRLPACWRPFLLWFWYPLHRLSIFKCFKIHAINT